MIRDELMQRVIHREMEPITPFIERIRELYEKQGISTVIVAGSSGAYFPSYCRYDPSDGSIRAERYYRICEKGSGSISCDQSFSRAGAAAWILRDVRSQMQI